MTPASPRRRAQGPGGGRHGFRHQGCVAHHGEEAPRAQLQTQGVCTPLERQLAVDHPAGHPGRAPAR
eukprot:2727783-Pleurochrysis_carterae.AAC.12